MREESRELSPACGTAFAKRTFAVPEEMAEWLSNAVTPSRAMRMNSGLEGWPTGRTSCA